MRLVQRLLLPQLLVTAIFVVALAYFVVAFARVAVLTGEVEREYLVDLEDEERLHRAAWDVEVAIRHGRTVCEASEERAPEIVRTITTAGDALRRTLETYPKGRALDHLGLAASSYVKVATDLSSKDVCARLAKLRSGPDALALDEELTNAWIARVSAIRVALAERESETKRVGTRAAIVGIVLALLSSLAGTNIALRTARGMTRSIASLGAYARSVGEGDFTPLSPVAGPQEIQALSLDLDRMRARLAELDQLKQSFVASVSHDLRTPLARLREALALLADGSTGPINDRQRRVVTLAQTACEKEIRIVTALLDLSRVRSGRPIQRRGGGSIDQIVRSAIADASELAAEAGVVLDAGPADPRARGSFDAMLLERALVNIIHNAISVSKRGDRVAITQCVLEPDEEVRRGKWAEIAVKDDGPGVDPALRDAIFEPYATEARRKEPEGHRGVGLGLSIAREMVRAHGGDVILVPDEPPGATFCLRVPLEGLETDRHG